MKISTRVSTCFVLLLTLLAALPASASCVETFTISRTETSEAVTGSDCWFGGYSDPHMRIYDHVTVTTDVNQYLFTINTCTRERSLTFLQTISSTTSSCWRKTSASCVGSQDWVPSPLCS